MRISFKDFFCRNELPPNFLSAVKVFLSSIESFKRSPRKSSSSRTIKVSNQLESHKFQKFACYSRHDSIALPTPTFKSSLRIASTKSLTIPSSEARNILVSASCGDFKQSITPGLAKIDSNFCNWSAIAAPESFDTRALADFVSFQLRFAKPTLACVLQPACSHRSIAL